MRALATSLSQLAVMGAIVATLLYLPAGIALALAFGLFGVPLEAVITFNGAFDIAWGLCAWWLAVFALACIYAACAFPWEAKAMGWPKKR
jgi:hypothetical protein